MAKRLIDGNELLRYAKKMEQLALNRVRDTPTNSLCYTRYAAQHTERKEFRELIENAPTVDAVEVSVLEKWLYEIAWNNTRNPLCDSCEEIIRRLPGLRKFAEEYGERKEG